jgi:anti-sigma-K factor RskA
MTDEDRELREQQARIEQVRNDLGDTVAELSARADVKARAKEKTAEIGERAREVTPDVAIKAVDEARRRPKVIAGAAVAIVALFVGRRFTRRRRSRK